MFQSGNGFQFHFQFPGGHDGGQDGRRKGSIRTEEFFRKILPGSHERPYLIYFYHDFCWECGRMDEIWREIEQVCVCMRMHMRAYVCAYVCVCVCASVCVT